MAAIKNYCRFVKNMHQWCIYACQSLLTNVNYYGQLQTDWWLRWSFVLTLLFVSMLFPYLSGMSDYNWNWESGRAIAWCPVGGVDYSTGMFILTANFGNLWICRDWLMYISCFCFTSTASTILVTRSIVLYIVIRPITLQELLLKDEQCRAAK